MTRTIELAVLAVLLLITALAVHAWLASRDEMQLLQSTMATQKQVIDAADSRERSRDAALNDAIAQIAKRRAADQTPAQILRDLPQYLPLPQPIALAASPAPPLAPLPRQGTALPAAPRSAIQTPSAESMPPADSNPARSTGDRSSIAASANVAPANAAPASTPGRPERPAPAPVAEIPAADLKPLYDYAQDCRSCELQIAAAKQDRADANTKIIALTHERDAALTAAKGGSFLRRVRRNSLWFVVGASAGYIASRR
jgi:hypothetical protein